MGSRVHPQQLLKGGKRCVVVNEIGINTLSNQVIIDGGQTLWAFRVMRTHVMQLAVAMGDEGSGCHLFSLSDSGHEGAPVEMSLSSHFGHGFKH